MIEWPAGRRRRLHEPQAADETRAVDLGVLGAEVFERPPKRGAVERLRAGHLDHRELEIIDGVMAAHGGRQYYVSVASPSVLSPYVFIFV